MLRDIVGIGSAPQFWKKLPNYAEVVGLPIDAAGFIAHIKEHLNTQAQKHEAAYLGYFGTTPKMVYFG